MKIELYSITSRQPRGVFKDGDTGITPLASTMVNQSDAAVDYPDF
jgi:hypothetical protein